MKLWRQGRFSSSRAIKIIAAVALGAVMIFLIPPEMDFSHTITPRSFADGNLRSITSRSRTFAKPNRYRKPVPHSVCEDDSSEAYSPQFDIFPRIPPITSKPNLQKAICEQERRQRAASKLTSFAPDADDDTKFLVRFPLPFMLLMLCVAGVHILGWRLGQPLSQSGVVFFPGDVIETRYDPRLA